jgi:hypothetical protein
MPERDTVDNYTSTFDSLAASIPREVGHYDLGWGLVIAAYKTPAPWHRFWTKILLGWRWVPCLTRKD